MEFVLYEQKGQYAIITINREKALNALNSAVLDELDKTLDSVDLDQVRCLILTGAGQKSFVAGADIAEMSTLTRQRAKHSVRRATMYSVNWKHSRSRLSLQ